MSQPRQFGIHVTRKEAVVDASTSAPPSKTWVLMVVMAACLGIGVPGLSSAWPKAVESLRQSQDLVRCAGTIVDTRVVELRIPDRPDSSLWRYEGLCEYKVGGLARRQWITLKEYNKRSEVVPGGIGNRLDVWFNPETDSVTPFVPNRSGRWFVLMFHMTLCLGGFASGLVLLQRQVQRWRKSSKDSSEPTRPSDENS